MILIAAEWFDTVCVGTKTHQLNHFTTVLQGTCVLEIIDLNRYGVFNWLADSSLGNLTRGGLFNKEKEDFLSCMKGFSCDVNLFVSNSKAADIQVEQWIMKWRLGSRACFISLLRNRRIYAVIYLLFPVQPCFYQF